MKTDSALTWWRNEAFTPDVRDGGQGVAVREAVAVPTRWAQSVVVTPWSHNHPHFHGLFTVIRVDL